MSPLIKRSIDCSRGGPPGADPIRWQAPPWDEASLGIRLHISGLLGPKPVMARERDVAIGEAVAKLVAYSRVPSAMVTATAAFLATYYRASSHDGAGGSARPSEEQWHLAASRMGDPSFDPETSWRFLERGMKSYATLEPAAWCEDELP